MIANTTHSPQRSFWNADWNVGVSPRVSSTALLYMPYWATRPTIQPSTVINSDAGTDPDVWPMMLSTTWITNGIAMIAISTPALAWNFAQPYDSADPTSAEPPAAAGG